MVFGEAPRPHTTPEFGGINEDLRFRILLGVGCVALGIAYKNTLTTRCLKFLAIIEAFPHFVFFLVLALKRLLA